MKKRVPVKTNEMRTDRQHPEELINSEQKDMDEMLNYLDGHDKNLFLDLNIWGYDRRSRYFERFYL